MPSKTQSTGQQAWLWEYDETLEKGYETPDEKTWKQEQRRRKRKPADPYPVPEDGPCCFRCRNWEAPKDDGFGICHVLVVAQERVPPRTEKGHVLAREEAIELAIAAERLRTRGNFACSAFHEAEEIAA